MESIKTMLPQSKLTHRKSIVIAFYRLLQAVRNEEDVLLLATRDPCANRGFQEYNDSHSEIAFDSEYGQFVDRLAAIFDRESMRNTLIPSMPSRQQLEEVDKMLVTLSHKCK